MATASLAWSPFTPDQVTVDTPVYEIVGPIYPYDVLERWSYRFAWSGIPVGNVTITGGESSGEQGKRLEVRVKGGTNAFVDLLWRYRLDAVGNVRLDPFAPISFLAEEQEKSREKVTRIEFDEKRRVRSHNRKGQRVKEYEFEAPNTYDILSTVYLLLNLDYELGKRYEVDTLTGTARYLVKVDVQAREKIDINGGEYDAYRLRVMTSEITDPDEMKRHRETHIWVSAERPRRLLRARSKTYIGAVYVDLVGIESFSSWGAVEKTAAGGAVDGDDASRDRRRFGPPR